MAEIITYDGKDCVPDNNWHIWIDAWPATGTKCNCGQVIFKLEYRKTIFSNLFNEIDELKERVSELESKTSEG